MKGTLQHKPQRPHSVWTGAVIWGYLGLALRWLRGLDLNQRPLGYEPYTPQLGGCSCYCLDYSRNHISKGVRNVPLLAGCSDASIRRRGRPLAHGPFEATHCELVDQQLTFPFTEREWNDREPTLPRDTNIGRFIHSHRNTRLRKRFV